MNELSTNIEGTLCKQKKNTSVHKKTAIFIPKDHKDIAGRVPIGTAGVKTLNKMKYNYKIKYIAFHT